MLIPYAHLTQADLPWSDGIAIIPVAALETHGPHLPLGTDGLIAEGLLDAAAERITAKTACLPVLWLGASAEHADHPGTLSREPEQMIADIVSLGEGLTAAGFRRVVIFNGHGGNIALGSIAALKLRTRFNMLAANVHWLDFGLPPGLAAPTPLAEDVHGGWVETSVLLHLHPQAVQGEVLAPAPATAPSPRLFPRGPVNWGWKIGDLQSGDASGWIGRPDLASAQLGLALVDHAAASLARLIDEMAVAPWP